MRRIVSCRSCLADVFWCKTEHGKAMPVDVNPVPDGNIVIRDDVAIYLKRDEFGVGEDRYKSHFATCPNAKQHRKAK